jgi:hypothetical protein
MLNKNKSRHYGYYGGVTNENHYVPPEVPDFVPQPASIPFSAEYRILLNHVLTAAGMTYDTFVAHLDRVLYRKILSATDVYKEFYMTNLENPDDVITYVSPLSGTVDLITFDTNLSAGGYGETLDGGIF